MKSKTVILMVVAIGCGLAASYMTSRVIADRSSEKPEEEKVAVLVAKKSLNVATILKEPEKLFEEKFFVKGEEPKKAIKTFDQLRGRMLNKQLSEEQFVTAEDLLDKSQDGLAAVVQKGMRAFGISVNVEKSGGGFVLPHSRVDIVHVMRRDNETTSKIIMQNVLVLAVDQASIRPEEKNSMVPQTATIEVTPKQAEMLALAQELGTLKLILRSFGDESRERTAGANAKSLTNASNNEQQKDEEEDVASKLDGGGSKATSKPWAGNIPDVPQPTNAPTPVVAEVKAVEAPKIHTLTIINGEQVTKAVYQFEGQDFNPSRRDDGQHPEPATTITVGPKPALPASATNPDTEAKAPSGKSDKDQPGSPAAARNDKKPAETKSAAKDIKDAPLPPMLRAKPETK